MKYSDFIINLINKSESEEDVLNELTERQIETEEEEFFSFCEYLRENLATRENPEEWKDALLDEFENDSWLKEGSDGNNGEA